MIDYILLQEQAETIGRLADRAEEGSKTKEHLEGVWELLHNLIDTEQDRQYRNRR